MTIRKPTIVEAEYEDFWKPMPRRRINWPRVAAAVFLAISAGMVAAWVYGIIRLLEVY